MIENNLQAVRNRMHQACAAAGRSVDSVTLLAVSKTQPASLVREAVAAGQRRFGENYVQEALDKIAELADLSGNPERGIEWHLIGGVQSNKTRVVAEHFDWVHTVDRLKIAQRLSEQRPAHLPALNVCIQVNISGEASKGGAAPAEVLAMAQAISCLPRLRLRGLMAIPEPATTATAQRAPHRALRELLGTLRAAALDVDTLSMGMSDDLEAAIAEGSTIVRVGTAIFGQRQPAQHQSPLGATGGLDHGTNSSRNE